MTRSSPPDADAPLDARRPAILTLAVRDLGRALAFWHGTLGIPLALRTPGRAELQSETFGLVLAERPDAPTTAGVTIAWEVDAVDAAAAWLAQRGVALEPRPDDAAAGRRIAFRDPDGHHLELVEYR